MAYATAKAPCTRAGGADAPPCDPKELKCSRASGVGTCTSLRSEGSECDDASDCTHAYRNCTALGGCSMPVAGGRCRADGECPAGSVCRAGGSDCAAGGAVARRGGVCVGAAERRKREGQRCSSLVGYVGVDDCDVSKGLICVPAEQRCGRELDDDGDLSDDFGEPTPEFPWGLPPTLLGARGDVRLQTQEGTCRRIFADGGNRSDGHEYPAAVGPLMCDPLVAEYVPHAARRGTRLAEGLKVEAGPSPCGVCRPFLNKECAGALDCGDATGVATWARACECDPARPGKGRCVAALAEPCMRKASALLAAARDARHAAAAPPPQRDELYWWLGAGHHLGEEWEAAAHADGGAAAAFVCCAAGAAAPPAPTVNGMANPTRAQWTDGVGQFASGVFDRYYDCSARSAAPARLRSSVVVDAHLPTIEVAGLSASLLLAFQRAAQSDIAVSLGIPQRRVQVTGLRHAAGASAAARAPKKRAKAAGRGMGRGCRARW
eukprot:gene9211-9146_t